MKLDNLISELHRQYPTGTAVHPINEIGSTIVMWIKRYIKHKKRQHLYVAYEYVKKLNKRINANLSLNDINEIINDPLIKEVESWDTP